MNITKVFSPYGFQETRLRILEAVKAHSLVLFAEFDHARAAEDRGLYLPPATVLVFGNPQAGTPLMYRHPELALDLPFRVLISEPSQGTVWVGFHPAEQLAVYGLEDAAIQGLKKLETWVCESLCNNTL